MSGDKIVVVIDRDLEDIVPGYIENRHKDIEALRKAVEEGDTETANVLGHRMKGSGAGYGFDEITEIGRHIETSAKSNDIDGVKKGVADLESYLQRVEVTYE
ncbi:Hpt domain-containing protein [Magnetofaba australis]|uniref:Putative Hpt protein n=1 Tax=Magnetofaba australis IT-1 TaxID=1434232 RepID=A0A1Y2K675_9PROT|nr:Hpt domain-containing protein [Magnetofaba australis]OSM05129.1 putative Hpt protein [Magnetofaba australis IT-1]